MNTESMSRCGEGFLPLWLMRRKEKRQKQSIPVSHHLECDPFFIQSVSLSAREPRCLCNLQLAVLIADSEGAEMFVQLAVLIADSEGAEMFVQLAVLFAEVCGQ